jgi:hypothetical protein
VGQALGLRGAFNPARARKARRGQWSGAALETPAAGFFSGKSSNLKSVVASPTYIQDTLSVTVAVIASREARDTPNATGGWLFQRNSG